MKTEEFAKRQIGMYVTSSKKANVSLVCSDFRMVAGFKKGCLVLQPLLNDGRVDSSKEPITVDHKDIELTHKLHASDFRTTIAVG